jgi:hypothetical protein
MDLFEEIPVFLQLSYIGFFGVFFAQSECFSQFKKLTDREYSFQKLPHSQTKPVTANSLH